MSKILILFLLFFYYWLAASFSFKAPANTCKAPTEEDNSKSTFCFFSLNNPKEFTYLKKQYEDANNEDAENIEIKEFYGKPNAGKPVSERFKEMMSTTQCDCLIISGHHTGYFAGAQSNQEKDHYDNKLQLNFLEDMSCEEGCADWFSNVKCLFLMGCQTVEPKKMREGVSTADSETIRLSVDHPGTLKNPNAHQELNQAYSSTLDNNHRLSHRYLRMFPNSSLYGWAGTSPGKASGSRHSLPNFIDLVSSLTSNQHSTTRHDTKNILNFIDFMNSSNTCHKYSMAGAWTTHWVNYKSGAIEKEAGASACFLEPAGDLGKKVKSWQKQGCALTQALKADPQKSEDITKAVQDILGSGPGGIHHNFNRLMSLITDKRNTNKPWYKTVLHQLTDSEPLKTAVVKGAMSDKAGFTRTADYLYFYTQMGWQDPNTDKELSTKFLEQLSNSFTKIGQSQTITKKGESKHIPKEVQKAHRISIYSSIMANDLTTWLHKSDKNGFETLRNNFLKLCAEEGQLYGHNLTYVSQQSTNKERCQAVKFKTQHIEQHITTSEFPEWQAWCKAQSLL